MAQTRADFKIAILRALQENGVKTLPHLYVDFLDQVSEACARKVAPQVEIPVIDVEGLVLVDAETRQPLDAAQVEAVMRRADAVPYAISDLRAALGCLSGAVPDTGKASAHIATALANLTGDALGVTVRK